MLPANVKLPLKVRCVREAGEFVVELPMQYDHRTSLLEYAEHMLVAHPTADPILIDRRTGDRVPLDAQRMIEAKLVAAKHLGQITGVH